MKKFLPAILILVILTGFFAASKKAWASESEMSNVFPPLPSFSGQSSGYVTPGVSIEDTTAPPSVVNPDSASVFFEVIIPAGMAWTDAPSQTTAASGKGTLDVADDFGGWDSVFQQADIANPLAQSDGFHLQIAKTSCLVAISSPSSDPFPSTSAASDALETCHTVDYSLNQLILTASDPSTGNALILGKGGATPIVFHTNISGLAPSTQYSLRINIGEDGSTDEAYSRIMPLTTPDASTVGQQLQPPGGAGGTTDTESVFGQLYSCGITTLLTDCVVSLFYYVLYVPSTVILTGAGKLFDVFANFSLSSAVYSKSTFVTDGWGIVRDIANIGFIIALIFIGFKTILGLHSGHDKATIATVIIVALLINFSLFIARTVVDGSNIFALIFYNQISVTGVTETPITKQSETGVAEKSISRGLVEGLNVQRVMSQESVDKVNKLGHPVSTAMLILILGLIVNLTAAWIFFVCSLLFVGRIAGLWFLMIFAPYAFVSYVLPGLAEKRMGWKNWWGELLSLSFLAPVFIFFVWIIIKFIHSDFLGDFLVQAAGSNPITDFVTYMITIIMPFVIIIVMLKEAKNLAQKMAGEMGESIVGFGTAALGFAVGAVAGGIGKVATKTIGARALEASKSEGLKERAAKGGLVGYANKMMLKSADYGAKSSFDLRKSAVGGAVASQTGMNLDNKYLKNIGLNTGALAGGRKADIEAKEKANLAEANRLKVDDSSYKKTAEYKDYEKGLEAAMARSLDARKKEEAEKGNPNYTKEDFKKEYDAEHKAPTVSSINESRMNAFKEQLKKGGTGAGGAILQQMKVSVDDKGEATTTAGKIAMGVLGQVAAARTGAMSKIDKGLKKEAGFAETLAEQDKKLKEAQEFKTGLNAVKDKDGNPFKDSSGKEVTKLEYDKEQSIKIKVDLDDVERQRNRIADKLAEENDFIGDGKPTATKSQQVIDAARARKDSLDLQKSDLNAKIMTMSREYAGLKKSVDRAENIDSEITRYRREVDRLGEKGEKMKKEAHDLEAKKSGGDSSHGGGGHSAPKAAPASHAPAGGDSGHGGGGHGGH